MSDEKTNEQREGICENANADCYNRTCAVCKPLAIFDRGFRTLKRDDDFCNKVNFPAQYIIRIRGNNVDSDTARRIIVYTSDTWFLHENDELYTGVERSLFLESGRYETELGEDKKIRVRNLEKLCGYTNLAYPGHFNSRSVYTTMQVLPPGKDAYATGWCDLEGNIEGEFTVRTHERNPNQMHCEFWTHFANQFPDVRIAISFIQFGRCFAEIRVNKGEVSYVIPTGNIPVSLRNWTPPERSTAEKWLTLEGWTGFDDSMYKRTFAMPLLVYQSTLEALRTENTEKTTINK